MEYVRRLSAIVLAAVMLIGTFAGCRKGEDEFPDVVFPEDTTSVSSEGTSLPDVDIPESNVANITVASPYSDRTVKYLAKLYYCKQNALMGDMTGESIDLDFLDGIDPDFIVRSVLTPVEGASADNITQWNRDNNAPDIFLTSQIADMKRNSLIEPLNEFISDDSLLSADRVYVGSVDQNKDNGLLYGIPYYSSVMLIIGNYEYIPGSGKLSFKNDKKMFDSYLKEIAKDYEIIPLSSGYDMVPYISSAFAGDTRCSFMMNEEYRYSRESAMETIGHVFDYVTEMYKDDLTRNTTSEGSNPVFSRAAGMWLASSAEIENWNSYYPAGIYVVSLPLNDAGNSVIPMATLYSLCINSSSQEKGFATDFASFMALDPDARMLTERLEHMTGFLPCIKSSDVWNYINTDPLFGQAATVYYQTLDNAVYCPPTSDKLYTSVIDYVSGYNGGDFDPEACYGQT